jgi:hypothetical protein
MVRGVTALSDGVTPAGGASPWGSTARPLHDVLPAASVTPARGEARGGSRVQPRSAGRAGQRSARVGWELGWRSHAVGPSLQEAG